MKQKILNFIKRLRLPKGKKIKVGTTVDVVFVGGCMDTEINRVKGIITSRSVNIAPQWYEHENRYCYQIEIPSGRILQVHCLWMYFNPETKIWEATI